MVKIGPETKGPTRRELRKQWREEKRLAAAAAAAAAAGGVVLPFYQSSRCLRKARKPKVLHSVDLAWKKRCLTAGRRALLRTIAARKLRETTTTLTALSYSVDNAISNSSSYEAIRLSDEVHQHYQDLCDMAPIPAEIKIGMAIGETFSLVPITPLAASPEFDGDGSSSSLGSPTAPTSPGTTASTPVRWLTALNSATTYVPSSSRSAGVSFELCSQTPCLVSPGRASLQAVAVSPIKIHTQLGNASNETAHRELEVPGTEISALKMRSVVDKLRPTHDIVTNSSSQDEGRLQMQSRANFKPTYPLSTDACLPNISPVQTDLCINISRPCGHSSNSSSPERQALEKCYFARAAPLDAGFSEYYQANSLIPDAIVQSASLNLYPIPRISHNGVTSQTTGSTNTCKDQGVYVLHHDLYVHDQLIINLQSSSEVRPALEDSVGDNTSSVIHGSTATPAEFLTDNPTHDVPTVDLLLRSSELASNIGEARPANDRRILHKPSLNERKLSSMNSYGANHPLMVPLILEHRLEGNISEQVVSHQKDMKKGPDFEATDMCPTAVSPSVSSSLDSNWFIRSKSPSTPPPTGVRAPACTPVSSSPVIVAFELPPPISKKARALPKLNWGERISAEILRSRNLFSAVQWWRKDKI